MDVETGAMGSLLLKMSHLLGDDYNLQKSVRREVELLSTELKAMHAVLGNVAQASPEMVDKHVRTWARQMREASYDIENIIDTILVSADGSGEPIDANGWLKRATKKMSNLPNKGRIRGDIVAAMEDIKKQLCEITQRRERYTFYPTVVRPVKATSSTVDPRLPALYRNERELVGIEEAREELVRLLTQGDAEDDKKREVKVVSIVGLAGVGKTTLAKAVYNRLQAQFDCSAFVSVSRNPDLKKVFTDILLELDEPKYHRDITTKRMDERQFIDEIQEFLGNKRCLIVIDDIWDVCTWETIRFALCYVHNGSRIITTSRISYVGKDGCGSTTYRLKPLCHVNSEKLFYKRIFGGEGIVPDSQHAEVSDTILKKCGGLPLAIITVASVLASKPREEWSEVYNNSIALGHESNRYVDNMRAVLSFSFYDLPRHLRTCLFHLSIFPENCLIEKDILIWKWVAEGFVDERGRGISLFEIGESYFNELVNRSTIEIAEECLKGHVYGYYCRVHPVLFSQIRAISSEENFCTVLEDEHHTSPPGNNNPRRVAMHSIRNVEHNIVPETNISQEKVRSFNCSLCFTDGIPQLSSFQVLRVLALEYCPGLNSQHHLVQIGNLVHLRYLGLVGAGVLELPEETLGGLRFLQTLDLRETDIEQWPRNISNLQHLMCLCVGRTRTVPEGMGSLSYSLEDLRLHLVSSCDSSKLTAELARLESLRVLVLGFEEMDVGLEKALLESLRKLPEIQRLEIYCKPSTMAIKWEESRWVSPRHLLQLVLGGLLFSGLPSWINASSLPILSHLHLEMEVLQDGDLEALGRLPILRSLMLLIAAASNEQEHRITAVDASDSTLFVRLSFFSINMPVRFESGLPGPPMPSLEHVQFRVRDAQIADSWLSSLANLKSLDKVTVVLNCRGASTEDAEKAEETLRRVTGVHPNRRLRLEVTKYNGNDEVPLVEQFSFKYPRFEALRSEMKKMQANRLVQVQPASDSDEIAPARLCSARTFSG